MLTKDLAETLPAPKFKIGEWVEYSRICDDQIDKEYYGKKLVCRGIILGVSLGVPDCFKRDIHSECWAYLVHVHYDSQPGLKPIPNLLESFSESELERCS